MATPWSTNFPNICGVPKRILSQKAFYSLSSTVSKLHIRAQHTSSSTSALAYKALHRRASPFPTHESLPSWTAPAAVSSILYETPGPTATPPKRHILNCLVQNEPGVLSRVSGILAARGFNIDSLVVCNTELSDLSRMTIVLSGQDSIVEQARRQLEDLVPVYAVLDYTPTPLVQRELLLAKVSTLGPEAFEEWMAHHREMTDDDATRIIDDITDQERTDRGEFHPSRLAASQALRHKYEHLDAITHLTHQFGGKVLDISSNSCIVEVSAKPTRIDSFMKLIKPFGILEAARTGLMAMPRSPLYTPGEAIEKDVEDIVDILKKQLADRHGGDTFGVVNSFGEFTRGIRKSIINGGRLLIHTSMMASNILFLPFRRTHAVSLSDAIKQYISTKYDQHPDMFRRDLEAIDQLRSDAVTSLEAHVSGIRKLSAYATQLVWIGGKFPIDIGVDFTWYPALGFNTQRPTSQNNLRFELANILYNLASLYSQLAHSVNRSTSEGLKSACNYFCQAAGVMAYLKTNIVPDMRSTPPEDMDLMTLESLQQLLLAQAQECFWSKAVKDGLKDGLIAKLAAKVSDFYDQAAEYGTKSDSISTEWIHHMTAKHHHFAAAAQYRASRDCLDKQKYGEEVARLRDSLMCVNEALKESRWVNKTILGDLNGLKTRVSEDLKRAEKDNDMIYLMPVPPKSELKTLDRAGMATPRIPQEISDPASALGERGIYGHPLFAKLVPYSVHVAASIYEERKNRLVNTTIIDELEGLTDKLRDLLQSLNLPGSLQALEKPLGLPPSLTSHAEEIRQEDGIHRIRRSMHEISKLKASDTAVYEEGIECLRSESAENDRAMLKHGTNRWTRPSSQEAADRLYKQAADIDGYLKSAASSDDLVKSKFKECENALQTLSGTDRDLEDFIPSSRRVTMNPAIETAANHLRTMLNRVKQLENRRRRTAEALRAKAKQDDIDSVILAETSRLERELTLQKIEPMHFEDLFADRLQRYDEDRNSLTEEANQQSTITTQLIQANSAFTTARKGDSSTREREKALQTLENAYVKYKEIVTNLNTGRKFYNDLAKFVTRFRDECKSFAYQRRTEAAQMETELEDAMAGMNLRNEQVQREHLRQQYRTNGGGQEERNEKDRREVMTAPTPVRKVQLPEQRVWSPDVGIKFGGAQGSGVVNMHKAAYPNTRLAGQWDPSQGVRFG